MSSAPYAAFAHADFRRYQLGRFVAVLGVQMGSVAVAWEVYDLTRRPLDLGFVGLAQFLPAVLLSLFTGAVADRFDRRRVVAVCHAVLALGWLLLALRATLGVRDLGVVYGVLVLLGTARAFQGPAASALVPNLVPPADLSNAVAWASTTWQVATIAGPSLGGLSLGLLSPTGVYAVSASAAVFALVNTLRVAPRPAAPRTAEPPMDRLLAGIRYVWRTPVVLGCISLDLFAVLLGGAVALLPVFARDILHAGPWALGVLRSAPAVGAALMALWLAHHPIARHAGRWMLVSVAVFGAATVVFGLSSSLALSVAALAVAGASDMVSVVIRQHAVQVATPDAMRGRVSAVNLVFVGASNELGEFESGVTAQFLGPVRAVVVGGVGTLLVVATWAGLFPALRTLDRLDELGPGEKSAGGA